LAPVDTCPLVDGSFREPTTSTLRYIPFHVFFSCLPKRLQRRQWYALRFRDDLGTCQPSFVVSPSFAQHHVDATQHIAQSRYEIHVLHAWQQFQRVRRLQGSATITGVGIIPSQPDTPSQRMPTLCIHNQFGLHELYALITIVAAS
jgi:hypothetical protein